MQERMGNPTPIGLLGLAIGCAALAPAELGLTTTADPMIWVWMLLTAGVLQVYAGVVDIINRRAGSRRLRVANSPPGPAQADHRRDVPFLGTPCAKDCGERVQGACERCRAAVQGGLERGENLERA